MRINPDKEKIHPGFLFAFLSCEHGNKLITAGTYGSIVVAIEPGHIEDIPVPRFSIKFENEVSVFFNTPQVRSRDSEQEIHGKRLMVSTGDQFLGGYRLFKDE